MSFQEINDEIKHVPYALLCAAEESPLTRVAMGVLAHTILLESGCLHDYSIKKMPKEALKQLFELILDLEDATLTNQQLYQKITSLSDKSLQQLLYQAVTHALQRPAEEVLKENPRLLLQLTTQKGVRLLYGSDFLRNPDPISTLLQEVAQAVLHPEPPLLLTNRQQAEEEICKTLAQKFIERLIPSDQAFRNLSRGRGMGEAAYRSLTEALRYVNATISSIENELIRYFIIREMVTHLSDMLVFMQTEHTSRKSAKFKSQIQEFTNLFVSSSPACVLSHVHVLDVLKFAMRQNAAIAELWRSMIGTFEHSMHGGETHQYEDSLIVAIKKFLFSEEELFVIATSLLEKSQYVSFVLNAIDSFAPKDSKEYEQILLQCAYCKPDRVYAQKAHYTLSPLVTAKIELLYAFSLLDHLDDTDELERFSKAARIAFGPMQHLFSKDMQQLFKDAAIAEPLQRVKHIQQVLFASACVQLQQQGISETLLQENSDVLYTFSTYRQLPFAATMIHDFCGTIINDLDTLERYYRLATHAHLREIAFLLCKLNVDVSNKKNPKKISVYYVDTLHAFLTSSKSIRAAMRDVAKNYTSFIFNALVLLEGESSLSNEDVASLLNHCAEGEFLTIDVFVERLALSGALSAFNKKKELLQALSQPNKTEALKACFRQSLQEVVDLTDIENIEECYQRTFETMRMPNAFPTYIWGLVGEEELPNVREALTHMVRGVLLGTLPAERYMFNTQHIKVLHEEAPEIFDQWQKNPPAQSIIVIEESRQKELVLVETDDPIDLFLSGSEVMGSCQRVDSSAFWNKCLLGYVLDGKIKMLAIKDPSGQVVARSILRLLINNETRQPVLFQEKMYANGSYSTYQRILDYAAEQRAVSLGICLGRASASSGEEVQVSSLDCPAPFEYEDSSDTGITNGTYSFSTHLVL